jgi:hypothetical protein
VPQPALPDGGRALGFSYLAHFLASLSASHILKNASGTLARRRGPEVGLFLMRETPERVVPEGLDFLPPVRAPGPDQVIRARRMIGALPHGPPAVDIADATR